MAGYWTQSVQPDPGNLDAVVLLNRTVYGGEFYLENSFRADYDPSIDPAAEGADNQRFALNVYDRYDTYLAQFAYQVLGAEELGFAPGETAAGATSADDLNVFYRGGLFRNTFQELPDGTLQNVPDAGAVALTTLNDNATGKTLNLVLRGTDADFGSDGEAGTGPGQVRYYGQLQPLIDKIFAYASDPSNNVTEVVVSGQSLGGTAADLFTIYDAARFDALDGVDLEVISISSAGIDPETLTLKPDFDPALVDVSDGDPVIAAPAYYTQFAHDQDFVYFPERYDFAQHEAAGPLIPAVFTAGALAGLTDAVQIGGDTDNGALIELETPLVPIYELTAGFASFFLPPHYMDLYELNGRNLAEALDAAGRSDFDRFIALNGRNFATENVESNNTVNGWALPVDDSFDVSAETGDVMILGLGGDDTVTLGLGDDFYFGGEGTDTVDLSASVDGAIVSLGLGLVLSKGPAGGRDELLSVENVVGSGGRDFIIGDREDNALDGAGSHDRLFGRAGDDSIAGGAGRDVIRGGLGDDTLLGGTGNDRLFGGFGHDTFEFDLGHDNDRIVWFRPGEDMLDISALGFTDFAEVEDAAYQRGRSTVIETSDSDSIRLDGVRLSELDADNFIFAIA
ncbi:MAG: calcium-binding protein [Pseudomonadota bacterium]